MIRQPHLNTIEGLAAAIRATNKTAPALLTYKGLRVLVALYNACEAGKVMQRVDLIRRLQALGNVTTVGATCQHIRDLRIKGYIEQDGDGPGMIIRPSLAGRNYIKAVERYLRNIRWAEY